MREFKDVERAIRNCKCAACQGLIPKGEWRVKFDYPSFNTFKEAFMHVDCAEVEINQAIPRLQHLLRRMASTREGVIP